jgi:hypothetical protein
MNAINLGAIALGICVGSSCFYSAIHAKYAAIDICKDAGYTFPTLEAT